jgi:hypothetical protein
MYLEVTFPDEVSYSVKERTVLIPCVAAVDLDFVVVWACIANVSAFGSELRICYANAIRTNTMFRTVGI